MRAGVRRRTAASKGEASEEPGGEAAGDDEGIRLLMVPRLSLGPVPGRQTHSRKDRDWGSNRQKASNS